MRRLVLWSLGIAVVAIAIGLASIDRTRLRDELAAEITKATGYSLKMEGDLRFSVLPSIGLSVRDVRIESPLAGQEHPLARAGQVEIGLNLLGSLSERALVLQDVGLHDVEIWLSRDAAGRGNWLPAALPTASQKATPAPTSSSSYSPIQPTPRNLEIEDLTLHFSDAASGDSLRLSLAKASLQRDHKGAPVEFDLAGDLDSEAFHLSGTVSPTTPSAAPKAKLWHVALELKMRNGADQLTAQGVTGALPDLSAVDMKIDLKSAEPASLAHRFGMPGIEAWEDVLGTLRLRGQLLGRSADALSLQNAVLEMGRSELLDLKISGSVGDLLGASGLEFQVAVESPELAKALKPLGLEGAKLGKAHLVAKVRGSADAPAAEKIVLHIQPEDGIELRLEGDLDYANDEIGGEVALHVEAKDLRSLSEAVLALQLPDEAEYRSFLAAVEKRPIFEHLLTLDSLQIAARLKPSGKRWSLTQLDAKVGPVGGDGVEISGKAGSIWPQTRELAIRIEGHLATPGKLPGMSERPVAAIEELDIKGLLSLGTDTPTTLQELDVRIRTESRTKAAMRGSIVLGEGQTDRTGSLEINIQAENLAELGKSWGGSLPEWGPFSAQAQLNGTLEDLDLDQLDIGLGKSRITGHGAYSRKNATPHLDLDLAMKTLDLRDPPWNPLKTDSPGHAAKAAPPDDASPSMPSMPTLRPADLKWLSATTGELYFHADRVLIREDWTGQDLSAGIRWGDGVLEGPSLDLSWPEGHLALRGELDAKPAMPKWSVGLAGRGLELGVLAGWVGYPHLATGHFETTAKLTTRGSAIEDLTKNLNGGFLLDVGKGTLAARYADAVALSLHISAETGDVPMNCFIAALAVEDGLVRTDALLWDTPDKQIRGMGMINLQERTVDLVLRPHLKQTIATAITAAIRVKGPLHDPTLRPEPLQTATDLTRGLIGRALHVVKEVSPEFTDAVKKVSPQLTDAVKKLGVTTNKALSATGVDVPLVIDLLQDSASCESVAKKPAVEALRTFEPADHFPRPEYAAHLPPSAPPSPKPGSGDAVAGKTTERGRSAN